MMTSMLTFMKHCLLYDALLYHITPASMSSILYWHLVSAPWTDSSNISWTRFSLTSQQRASPALTHCSNCSQYLSTINVFFLIPRFLLSITVLHCDFIITIIVQCVISLYHLESVAPFIKK